MLVLSYLNYVNRNFEIYIWQFNIQLQTYWNNSMQSIPILFMHDFMVKYIGDTAKNIHLFKEDCSVTLGIKLCPKTWRCQRDISLFYSPTKLWPRNSHNIRQFSKAQLCSILILICYLNTRLIVTKITVILVLVIKDKWKTIKILKIFILSKRKQLRI